MMDGAATGAPRLCAEPGILAGSWGLCPEIITIASASAMCIDRQKFITEQGAPL